MLAVCPITAKSFGIVVFSVSLKSLLLKKRSSASWLFIAQSFAMREKSLVCVVWCSQWRMNSYSFWNWLTIGGTMK